MDESGAKTTAGRTFVVGGVKLRKPGLLARQIKSLRDQWGFRGEFKFSEINRTSTPIYFALVDLLAASDAHLIGCVVRASHCNPFGRGKPEWLVHAEVASQLVVGAVNRREVVSLLMDGISTPPDESLEETVKSRVNRRLRGLSVVTAVCADSRTSDLLQIADLAAGCMLFDRRRSLDGTGSVTSGKGKVVTRLAAAFDCPDLRDGRSLRVNIATYGTRPKSTVSQLRVVGRSAS